MRTISSTCLPSPRNLGTHASPPTSARRVREFSGTWPEARQPGVWTSYKPAACPSAGPSTDMPDGEIKTWNTRVDIWPNLFRTRVRVPPPPPIFKAAKSTQKLFTAFIHAVKRIYGPARLPVARGDVRDAVFVGEVVAEQGEANHQHRCALGGRDADGPRQVARDRVEVHEE